MYNHNADTVHAMCGMIPVSPQDAPGIIAAAQAIKDRHDANEQLSRDLIEAARDAQGG